MAAIDISEIKDENTEVHMGRESDDHLFVEEDDHEEVKAFKCMMKNIRS
jgi:hypothetical protein